MRLSLATILLLPALLPAQMRPAPPPPRPAPMPPAAIPVVAPPVDHPVYGGQPNFPRGNGQTPTPKPSPNPGKGPRKGGPGGPAVPAAPGAPAVPSAEEEAAKAFLGERVAGRDLKKRVKEVRELGWVEDLDKARARAAAAGKPVFWVQALGDLDGFA